MTASADWRFAARRALNGGRSAIAVSVAGVQGSSPRGLDATLLVTRDGLAGSVGGGVLEHVAIQRARRWLEQDRSRPGLWAFPLSADTQQCCGGVVVLAFEPLGPADRHYIDGLTSAHGEWCSALSLEPGDGSRFLEVEGRPLGQTAPDPVRQWWRRAADADWGLVKAGAHSYLCRRMTRPSLRVALFGAGHVGRALVRALSPLDVRVQWFDGRADAFPDTLPPSVERVVSEDAVACLQRVPSRSHVRIMTHRHPLDYAICLNALRRDDLASVGLIGSATKRRRFVKALQRDGLTPDQAEALICPIGLPELPGKAPAIIAASAVADLLIRQGDAAAGSSRRCGISEAEAADSPAYLAD